MTMLIIALGAVVALFLLALALALAALREQRRGFERALTERAALTAQLAAQHQRDFDAVHASYRTLIDRLAQGALFGTTAPVRDVEPTYVEQPEERVDRRVRDDAIEYGVGVLRREYEARGLRPSEEELRQEAAALLGREIPVGTGHMLDSPGPDGLRA